MVLDPSMVQRLVQAHGTHDPLAKLSPRERDVLAWVAKGLSNVGIARAMYVSEGTVEKHVSRVLAKLDLREDDDHHGAVRAAIAFRQSRSATEAPDRRTPASVRVSRDRDRDDPLVDVDVDSDRSLLMCGHCDNTGSTDLIAVSNVVNSAVLESALGATSAGHPPRTVESTQVRACTTRSRARAWPDGLVTCAMRWTQESSISDGTDHGTLRWTSPRHERWRVLIVTVVAQPPRGRDDGLQPVADRSWTLACWEYGSCCSSDTRGSLSLLRACG